MPRPVILHVAIAIAAAGMPLAACSGAAEQDVLGASSAGASSSSSGSSSGSASSSSGGASSSSSGASGTPGSSGTSGTTAPCAPEQEPNDNAKDANLLAPSRCGTLDKRDKRDFLTFRLQPSTQKMSIDFTGRVRLEIDVQGQPTTVLTPDHSGAVPFVLNEDYFIEVVPDREGGGGDDVIPWTVTLVED